MASEADFASDSDEGFRTKVSDKHLVYLKERIIQCIADSNNISAEVQHEQGKPAKLFVTIDSAFKTGRSMCFIFRIFRKKIKKFQRIFFFADTFFNILLSNSSFYLLCYWYFF